MRVIDCHVHLYPPEANQAPARWAAERGEPHWAKLSTRVRKDGRAVQGFLSVDRLLRAMDLAGVERAILQGWYWEKHDTCVAQNRFYAECLRAYPDRLCACATFHPSAGKNAVAAELHWAKEKGFCGLGELSPHSQGFSLENSVWREVLELAEALHFPVLLHVTEPEGKGYPGRVLTPLGDFVRLARAHPGIRFILAHWGARLPARPSLADAVCSLSNVYYDTAASPLLYDLAVFREIISVVGPERVLFGSDYPLILFPTEESEPAIALFLEKAKLQNLSPTEQAALFSGNARTVFDLD